MLSGYVNKMGYLFSAVGPLVVGFVVQVTDSWTISVLFLMAVILMEVPAIWVLARERSVDHELTERNASAHLSN